MHANFNDLPGYFWTRFNAMIDVPGWRNVYCALERGCVLGSGH